MDFDDQLSVSSTISKTPLHSRSQLDSHLPHAYLSSMLRIQVMVLLSKFKDQFLYLYSGSNNWQSDQLLSSVSQHKALISQGINVSILVLIGQLYSSKIVFYFFHFCFFRVQETHLSCCSIHTQQIQQCLACRRFSMSIH